MLYSQKYDQVSSLALQVEPKCVVAVLPKYIYVFAACNWMG